MKMAYQWSKTAQQTLLRSVNKSVENSLQISGCRYFSCGCESADKSTREKLLCPVAPRSCSSPLKVTIVGAGSVGTAAAICLLTQGITRDLVLIDKNSERLKGETLDLQHGACLLKDCKIRSSTGYEISENSKVCIITAGAHQQPSESRLRLIAKNSKVVKKIVSQVVKHSPGVIIVQAANPVDIMAYVSWKVSCLPTGRVIGSGTNLDSCRFKQYIANRLKIAPADCHAWIIGEHGDSGVPVWSGVNVAGTRLREITPKMATDCDKENWAEVHKKVVTSANSIIKRKGYTNWGIALNCCAITAAILNNTNSVMAVGVRAKGLHGIKEDVYLSLPAVIGSDGVSDIVNIKLSEKETALLRKSAQIIQKTQCGVQI